MENLLSNNTVCVSHDLEAKYPDYPYNPSVNYPEFRGDNRNSENTIYENVRNILFSLGLDKNNFGKINWNPLGQLVTPGQHVLIKPNWVTHHNTLHSGTDDLITHTSIIKAMLDYALLALNGHGKITIADAPLQNCNFREIQSITHISELVNQYRNEYPKVQFDVIDLRQVIFLHKQTSTQAVQRDNKGDPQGYSLVQVNERSLLCDKDELSSEFRVTNYDYTIMQKHHGVKKHEYMVSNSVLGADLIIDIPKMKCHIKAGLTGALKNFIGMNGNKEYLPHHIVGSPDTGGDQYIYPSRIKKIYNSLYDSYWMERKHRGIVSWLMNNTVSFLVLMSRLFDKDDLLDGGWSGNDTIPRTTIDLNNILYYYDQNKMIFHDQPFRKVLHIVDGIVAGEGNGPLRPSPKKAGVLIGGFNPVYVDVVMAKLMGYNPYSVKTISLALNHPKSLLVASHNMTPKIDLFYNGKRLLVDKLPNLHFIKPKYWKNAEQ